MAYTARKWLPRRGRSRGWFGFAALLALAAGCSPMRVSITDEELATVANTTHVMRIQAELEFDGEPVTLDEYVLCRGNVRKKLGEPAQGGFTSNRSTVFVEIPSGGLLRFPAAFYLCGTFGHIWGGWSLENSLAPPPNFIPYIRYIRAEPTVELEEYFSGLYYEKPRRLQIRRPFRISIPNHPPTPEDLRKAEEQSANNWRLYEEYAEILRQTGRREGWMVTAHIVPEEYWSKDPAISALVETLPKDQLSEIEVSWDKADWDKSNANRQLWLMVHCDNPHSGFRYHRASSWGCCKQQATVEGVCHLLLRSRVPAAISTAPVDLCTRSTAREPDARSIIKIQGFGGCLTPHPA